MKIFENLDINIVWLCVLLLTALGVIGALVISKVNPHSNTYFPITNEWITMRAPSGVCYEAFVSEDRTVSLGRETSCW